MNRPGLWPSPFEGASLPPQGDGSNA